MAEEELSAPFEKEDRFNSSINSTQTTDVGREEAKDESLEGTLQSNHSKEFSFGTTEPAKLPAPQEIDELAARLPVTQEIDELALASAREDLSCQQEHGMKKTTSWPKSPQLQWADTEANRESPLAQQMSSPSSENNEAFTFGTTTPLKLPDPALLRQAALATATKCACGAILVNDTKSCYECGAKNPKADVDSSHGCVEPKAEERAIVPVQPVADRHQQFQPHPHVPLPPVNMEPPPPLTPQDEALSIRSVLSGSHRSFQGEIACYAPPPPQQQMMQQQMMQQQMMQVPFMPSHFQQPPTPQTWYNPHVFMPTQYAAPPVSPLYAAEVSSAPEEFANQQRVEEEYQEDNDYNTSDQAALKTAEFAPEDSAGAELSLQMLQSAFSMKRRGAAACCIVILVAMAAGVVVVLVK